MAFPSSTRSGGLDLLLDGVASAPRPACAVLVVLEGCEPGRILPLDRPEVVIGRSRAADIHYSQRAMSQRHARLIPDGDTHRLEDLRSTNGTFVNDQRVRGVRLRPGDVIRIGETTFCYLTPDTIDREPAPVLPLAPPSSDADGRERVHAELLQRDVRVPRVASPYDGTVLHAPPAAEPEVDLVTWLLRGIGFLRRYWLSLVLLTLLGAGLGGASYKYVKPLSKAEFEITLLPTAADNPVEDRRRANFEFFRNTKTNFTRPALIAEALRQTGEQDVTAPRVREVSERLELAKSDQYAFVGSYLAPTPEEAVAFVEAHLQLFHDAEIAKALRVLQAEEQTFADQLAEAEEQLTGSDEALLAFKQEHSEGLPDIAAERYRALLDLGARKSEAEAALVRARNDKDMHQRRASDETPEIETRIEAAQPYTRAIAEQRRRLVELYAAGKSELHPDVMAAKDALQDLEDLQQRTLDGEGLVRIERSVNPAYKRANRDLAEAKTAHKNALTELHSITRDLEQAQAIVDDLPRVEAEYAELTRTYEATQRNHADLFAKLTAVRVRLQLEEAQAASRYEVTTPPNVAPVSKTRVLIMRGAIGGALGLFLAFALGILRELRRLVRARLATAARP